VESGEVCLVDTDALPAEGAAVEDEIDFLGAAVDVDDDG
jgi:hypothetical protein